MKINFGLMTLGTSACVFVLLAIGLLALPATAHEQYQHGYASWYSTSLHGGPTASGEPYDMYEMTAAHKDLPFGTIVTVRSLTTGRTTKVRITDRGPFVPGRIIDLSYVAARELGILDRGVDEVEIFID